MSFQSAIGQPVSQAISVAALLYTQTGRFKAQQAEKELKYRVQREKKGAQKTEEAVMNREGGYVPREKMTAGQKAAEDFDVQTLIEHAKKRLELDPTDKEALADLESWSDYAAEAKETDERVAKEREEAAEKRKAEKQESAEFARQVMAPETPADKARKAVMEEQMRIRGGKEYNVSI